MCWYSGFGYKTAVVWHARGTTKGGMFHETECQKQLPGKVTDIQDGAVNAIVKIDIGGGNVVSATISREAVRELGLKDGGESLRGGQSHLGVVAIDDSPATRA